MFFASAEIGLIYSQAFYGVQFYLAFTRSHLLIDDLRPTVVFHW